MLLLHAFLFLALNTFFVFCAPPNDKALFEEDAEGRIRRRRPCQGRTPQGRTFFDWSFQHIDIDYNTNHNYNVLCGGGGGGNRPQHDLPIGGGSNKPHKPHGALLNNLIQNQQGAPGNPPNRPVLNFVQTQTQSIVANLGNLLPNDGIGSLIPQNFGQTLSDSISSIFPSNGGGLFNGQGVSSLFDNGLFSNIFNNQPSPPANAQPSRPIGAPGQFPPQSSPPITTPKPQVQDPDDIIYNDERPVHEDHDPIVPDAYHVPLNRPAPNLNRPAYNNGYRRYDSNPRTRIRFND